MFKTLFLLLFSKLMTLFFGNVQPTFFIIIKAASFPALQQSCKVAPFIYWLRKPPKKASPAPFKSQISSFFKLCGKLCNIKSICLFL